MRRHIRKSEHRRITKGGASRLAASSRILKIHQASKTVLSLAHNIRVHPAIGIAHGLMIEYGLLAPIGMLHGHNTSPRRGKAIGYGLFPSRPGDLALHSDSWCLKDGGGSCSVQSSELNCILNLSPEVNMNHYKVLVHSVWKKGIVQDSTHYEYFYFGADEPLESLAERLATKGFFDEKSQRWFLPGAIVSIERN
jgi:hypothetical protein